MRLARASVTTPLARESDVRAASERAGGAAHAACRAAELLTISLQNLDERRFIQRESIVIPNPRGAQQLLRGDQVVAYGKLLTLKQLIPRDALGRRRPTTKPRKRKSDPS